MARGPVAAPTSDDGDHVEFLAAVDEGLADAKAGRVTPYEAVRRWLLSWGSERETSPPECP